MTGTFLRSVWYGIPLYCQEITWTNGRGDDIGNDVRFVVTESGDLVISSVTWDDMGQYTCTAKNLKGATSVNTFLYPLAPGL